MNSDHIIYKRRRRNFQSQSLHFSSCLLQDDSHFSTVFGRSCSNTQSKVLLSITTRSADWVDTRHECPFHRRRPETSLPILNTNFYIKPTFYGRRDTKECVPLATFKFFLFSFSGRLFQGFSFVFGKQKHRRPQNLPPAHVTAIRACDWLGNSLRASGTLPS